jgi:predicted MPP superfamily phosphohydrolase
LLRLLSFMLVTPTGTYNLSALTMSFFILTALFVWTCMHGYVFWRLGSLPVVAGCVPGWAVWGIAVVFCLSLPASRWLLKFGYQEVSAGVEVFALTWLGVLFLLFVCFLAVDCLTLGGLFLSARLPQLRTFGAALALVLAAVAVFQGMRAPVVNEQEVTLPGLPKERDGLRIVFISDLHLGSQIGQAWLHDLTGRISALAPDLIAVGGDLVDHGVFRVQGMIPELRALHAPLGVWAVLGNHDSYGGAVEASRIMQEAGFRVLHDESAVAVPGLRIAGVDDLGVRGRSGPVEPAIRSSLQLVRPGREGCVYLSHTPVGAKVAAEAGAGLMLCGHTHGGQIWPFNFLVRLRYPELVGRFNHDPMTLIVSRGAGTWGPRMRLWQPGEILLITLRAP